MEDSTRLAIGAIVKNEFPYILEWIAFHKIQGVSKFYIADNNSADNTSELLLALHSIGIIQLIPYPMVGDTPSQLRAYTMMLQKYHKEFDWIAFIDADEFICPTTDGPTFSEYLLNLPDDIGAIALNWAIFGSSNLNEYSQDLTIERFQKRAEKNFHINHHFKSVVSSKAYYSAPLNPHRFHLSSELRFVHTDLQQVLPHDELGIKVSKDIVWDAYRLNHYNIRSKDEFFGRKATRGLADSVRVRNNQAFFQQRDRNEVVDTTIQRYVVKVQETIDVIVGRLAQAGYHYGSCGLLASQKQFKLDIEKVVIEQESIRIYGSGYHLQTKDPIDNFKVFINDLDCRLQVLRKRNSRKMQPSLSLDSSCGFDIAAAYIGPEVKFSNIRLRAYDSLMDSYDEISLCDYPYATAMGYVDNAEFVNDQLYIYGWFKFDRECSVDLKILLRAGAREITIDSITRIARADVVDKHPEAPLMCGFEVQINQKLSPTEFSSAEIYVVAGIAATHIGKTPKAAKKFISISTEL